MLQAAVTAFAIAAIGASAADVKGPMVEIPADGSRTPMIEEPPLVLPAERAGGGAVIEASIESILRDYCLQAVNDPGGEARLAQALGAQSVPNPWFGRAFQDGVPAHAWALPGAPRSFFWVEADETGVTSTCWLKAFEGRRSVMAPVALAVIEGYAETHSIGPALHDPRPLAALEREGVIDRTYRLRAFSGSLSWDRSDYPALEGFVVTISAMPQAKQE